MKKDLVFMLIISVLFFLLFTKKCGKNTEPEIEQIIKSDTVTVYKQGKPDTLIMEKIKIVYKEREPDEVTQEGGSVKKFTFNFSDSLISDAIFTATLKEKDLKAGFSYVPKFPQYITRVDTFKTSVTTLKEVKRLKFYYGAVIGGNLEKFSFTPSILVNNKDKAVFSLGYDVLNKTYHLGGFKKF